MEGAVATVDQAELDQFYSAFLKASRDGKIATLAEFSQVFTAMGITDPTIIENTFRAWDLNGDGTLGMLEFPSLNERSRVIGVADEAGAVGHEDGVKQERGGGGCCWSVVQSCGW